MCVFVSSVFNTCNCPKWVLSCVPGIWQNVGPYSQQHRRFDVCLKTAALTDLLPCFQKRSQITRNSAHSDVVLEEKTARHDGCSPITLVIGSGAGLRVVDCVRVCLRGLDEERVM